MSLAPAPLCRVLLVESDAAKRAQLQQMIESVPRSRFEVTHSVGTLAEAIAHVRQGQSDLVLLDLSLPDAGGLETFARMHHAAPETPIVVLSRADEEEVAFQTVHQGAQEYLVTERLDSHLLHRAMRYSLERSRTASELARERDLLHTLIDNIPDRIYFKDAKSRFVRINHALMRLFGMDAPEEAYGKTDADFYGAEHAADAREDERRVMETGEPIINKIEFEIRTTGQKSWSLTTKLPLRDRHGRIIGTCGISREITELKEMEEQLANERNVLRSVIDNLPDLIFLKDVEGRYLLDNVAHQRWLHASDASEVLGRTVHDFYPDEIAGEFHADDEEILRSGQPLFNHEERIIDADGTARWVLTTKIPWRGDDGTIHGLVCIARDVTERKQSEENLRQAYSDLARSREELLTAMEKLQDAHQQLRDVQLQLVEAEKMKSIGRLAAGVAHEVKNPLAIIKMGTEYLRSQPLGADAMNRTILSDMGDAVDRADAVIRGLLDFSAPKKIEVRAEDLNGIIERALALVRGDLTKIEVIREFGTIPILELDAGKMGQVFINLITNAIHAMPAGGTLSVRTYGKQLTGVGANISDARSESFRVGQTLVVAEIDDTGEGIPEEKLMKVFEPFFTTKPTGKGTGLGLSVVKTIIDLHGGTVDIRNLPAGGVRVTLMFQA
jgi:PAS domain S-box-containing protein